LPWRAENRKRAVRLEGSVPLLKIHGSLNWVVQDGRITLYQDTRAAFRRGGDAAIVPPVLEKQMPTWLQPVWMESEKRLSQAVCWVVCGYSLPSYDIAMHHMLSRAGASGKKRLFILDPAASHLRPRWEEVSAHAEIVCLPGLPEGIRELTKRI
jgi:hypothetical protein